MSKLEKAQLILLPDALLNLVDPALHNLTSSPEGDINISSNLFIKREGIVHSSLNCC
jgi:hypothetical protein